MSDKQSYIYGIIGALALLLVGGIAGYILNGSNHINRSSMTEKQCIDISDRITDALRTGSYDALEKLNKIYSENCVDRDFEESKPQPKAKEEKLPETTCEAIEELLKKELYDENSLYPNDHEHNFRTYTRLAEKGCEKNKAKYLKLASREMDIAKALGSEIEIQDTNQTTCEQIEDLLTERLKSETSLNYSYTRVNRAKIYANLSERGCPENSQKYKELAAQELQIARALNDDNLENGESIEIVETYKRLQMQQEAERMIEKAKKLTNPAIDFIIQLEKIIEE